MEELVRYKSRKGTNDVRALESNKTTCLADEDNRSLIPIDRHEIKSKVSGENQSADKLDFTSSHHQGMNGDPFAQLREEILPFLKLRFEFVRRKKKNLAIYFRRAESKFGKNRLLSIPRVIPNSSQLVDARSIERIRNGATPLLISTEILLFSPPHNPVSAFFVSRSGKFGNAIRPPSPVPPNSRRGRVGFSGWDAKMKRGP